MALPRRKRLKPGAQVVLSLTLDQADLITQDNSISENLLAALYRAKVYNNVVRLRGSLDTLDQLARHVATQSKKTKDNNLRQELDRVLEAIRTLEQSYYGAPLRLVAINRDESSN